MGRVVGALLRSFFFTYVTVLLLVTMAAILPLLDAQDTQAFSWQSVALEGDGSRVERNAAPAAGVRRVVITGATGDIEVSSSSREEVLVLARVHDPERSAAGSQDSGAPGPAVLTWRQRHTVQVTSRLRSNGPRARIDLDVQVPPAVHVSVHAARGDVRIAGIDGQVEAGVDSSGGVTIHECGDTIQARATVGSVRVEGARADVTARSSNGDVFVSLAEYAPWLQEVRASTVNGDVTFAAGSGIGLTLYGETSNGEIVTADASSSLAIETPGGNRRIHRSAVGDGQVQVVLRTVNGSIQLGTSP